MKGPAMAGEVVMHQTTINRQPHVSRRSGQFSRGWLGWTGFAVCMNLGRVTGQGNEPVQELFEGELKPMSWLNAMRCKTMGSHQFVPSLP